MDKKLEIKWIVQLRALACIAIVLIHIVAGWNGTTNVGLNGDRFILDGVIVQALTRWAIPVFIMISGCLLLNPNKNVEIEKIKKYIKRMIIVLITFGFAFCLIESFFNNGTNDIWKVIYTSIFNLVQGKSWAVMWYAYMLIGLYIITPILRGFIKNASDKEMKFVIYGLLIFTVLIPTINSICNINITTFYLEGLIFITIYLLGYILVNKNYFNEKLIYIGGIIGIVGYGLLCYFKLPNSQENIFAVLIAMALITLFSKKDIKLKGERIIRIISEDSFFIYLIHTFWINVANKGFNLYYDVLPIGVGELVFFIATLILSIISAEIMKRLPILKSII